MFTFNPAKPIVKLNSLTREHPLNIIAYSIKILLVVSIAIISGLLPWYSPLVIPLLGVPILAISIVCWKIKHLIPINANAKIEHHITEIKNSEIHFRQIQNTPVTTIFNKNPKIQGKIIAKYFKQELIQLFDLYYNYLSFALELHYNYQSLTCAWRPAYYDINSPLFKTNINDFIDKKYDKLKWKINDNLKQRVNGFTEIANPYIKELNKNSWFTKRKLLTKLYMQKLIVLPDIIKASQNEQSASALLGCTSAVRNKSDVMQLFHNFDYFSGNILAKSSGLLIYPTDNLPIASFSFLPYFATLAVTNGKAIATVNDAGTTSNKRSIRNGLPTISCLEAAIQQNITFEQFDNFFLTNYPASTCTFIIANQNGGAIYQMAPQDRKDLVYNKIILKPKLENNILATNHHFYHHDLSIVNPESMNWPDSIVRYHRAKQALLNNEPWHAVLKSANADHTIHAMCFEIHKNTGKITLRVNCKNANAAAATPEEYSQISITELLLEVQQPQSKAKSFLEIRNI